jgi:hypothetical protein
MISSLDTKGTEAANGAVVRPVGFECVGGTLVVSLVAFTTIEGCVGEFSGTNVEPSFFSSPMEDTCPLTVWLDVWKAEWL